jgi:mono/diheme cytochrome c family protein
LAGLLGLVSCNRQPTPEPAETYERYCAVCHGSDGMSVTGTDSPQLSNPSFLAAADATFLRDTIARGRPGTKMSTFGEELGGPMTGAEIDAVVKHILTWRDPTFPTPAPFDADGDPGRGRELYAGLCASCHGADGRSATTPDLASEVFQSAASDAFIKHAVTFGRPGTEMEPFDLSEPEMNDLISFLRTLPAE